MSTQRPVRANWGFSNPRPQGLGGSARRYHRVLRIARTIAELGASPDIETAQLTEAVQMRRGIPTNITRPMHFTPAVQLLETPSAQSWCFVFVEGRLLMCEDQALRPWDDVLPDTRHYLGRLGGIDCWTFKLEAAPPGWLGHPLRAAMMGLPEPLQALAGRAAQLLEWDRAHRFCGVCGTPTEMLVAERARRCPACAQQVYPRINPAMMALVWRGQELLLARSPGFTSGYYSALAGFVEAGETLEECVHREVREEVGVSVRSLSYYGSQSWPFPHSLMVAYRAEWTGGEIVPQPGEIEAAAWFHIDDLPPIPPRFSISGHLIRDTAAWLRG